jgi:hypothetical protein
MDNNCNMPGTMGREPEKPNEDEVTKKDMIGCAIVFMIGICGAIVILGILVRLFRWAAGW